MADKLPAIIITGASGIVGKSFVEAAKHEFLIYALARRSQKEAGIAEHPNIKWIQVDIANWISLRWVMHNIKRSGGVDYVVHLAAYYDFEYKNHPEYERTNVNGTRYILEQCKILRVKRFIFASSTAACNFPEPGKTINEQSPTDANYAYAEAKRKGEEMVHEFSKWFPCTIVRFAAVFTDWCEYGVLYMLLSTWLSNNWDSRIMGGKGGNAVPYIHSHDLNEMLLTILRNSSKLPHLDTYIASPDGSTSQREIFETATRFYYGKRIKPICMPKFIALPGVIARDLLGRLIGKRPFVRPWMIKYLNSRLDVDASYTREKLSWQPTPRFHILRRLLFLIEKMKSDPLQWHSKNTTALKRISLRPNLLIYETMMNFKEEVLKEIKATLLSPQRADEFPNYQKMTATDFDWYVGTIFQLLSSSIRNNDRMFLLDYIKDLSSMRFRDGFNGKEVCGALFCIGEISRKKLKSSPRLKGLEQEIHDNISITIQMMADEVEDAFENFNKQEYIYKKLETTEIDNRLNKLESFYQSPKIENGREIEEEHLLQ